MTEPSSTALIAFIVGIERYDQPDWDVPGPCLNAIKIAQHLVDTVQTPSNIFVFTNVARTDSDAVSRSTKKALDQLKARGIDVQDDFDKNTIDTAFRKLSGRKGRLLFYWSGHGYTDNSGNRIFICPDYRSAGFANRVFNATRRFEWLHSDEFAGLTEQILLADVCAKTTKLEFEDDTVGTGRRAGTIRQVGLFATPEDAYAYIDDGSGVFTDLLLGALRSFSGWPDLEAYYKEVKTRAFAVNSSPFIICGFGRQERLDETYAGTLSEESLRTRRNGRPATPLIANYVAACGALDALVSASDEHRILLVKGEAGFGKSLLVIECAKQIPQDIAYISAKVTPDYHITELLSRVLLALGHENLPTFVAGLKALAGPLKIQIGAAVPFGWDDDIKRELARGGTGKVAALIECLFRDIARLAKPIIFILDSFEASSPELRHLIEEHFLSFVARTPAVRAIISGRVIPDQNNIEWAHCCAPICDLAGVPKAVDWMPIVTAMRRRIENDHPESFLAGICQYLGGRPNKIMEFIQALPEESQL